MSEEEFVPPEPQLMESMRAVGYTLDAAIADLIDNSLTAGAVNVNVYFSSEPNDYVAILDDGAGMDQSSAREAMRLAGRSPLTKRNANDLGRFGLGLKTASISQCRDVVLVTKNQASGTHAYRWDLDHLVNSGTWALLRLDSKEIAELPHADKLDNLPNGTLVIWQELDQLRAQTGPGPSDLDKAFASAKVHLALVFHRFLAGEHGRSFRISVNGVRLQQIDPFLSDHLATLKSPTEQFKVLDSVVKVQAFTLPLITKLNAAERRRAHVLGNMRESQGFYIYRAMRLVIWGTWFRILPREDLGKLARVRVDIPNSLDHLWALDIKKAAASPPPAVRDRLKRIAEHFVNPSKEVHLSRGRPQPSSDKLVRLWQLTGDEQDFRYAINREHPLLDEFNSKLDDQQTRTFAGILRTIEDTFPSQDLFNRLSRDYLQTEPTVDFSWLENMAVELWRTYKIKRPDAETFVQALASVEPFNRAPNPASLLRKATQNEQ